MEHGPWQRGFGRKDWHTFPQYDSVSLYELSRSDTLRDASFPYSYCFVVQSSIPGPLPSLGLCFVSKASSYSLGGIKTETNSGKPFHFQERKLLLLFDFLRDSHSPHSRNLLPEINVEFGWCRHLTLFDNVNEFQMARAMRPRPSPPTPPRLTSFFDGHLGRLNPKLKKWHEQNRWILPCLSPEPSLWPWEVGRTATVKFGYNQKS